MPRLFFALWPDPSTRSALANTGSQFSLTDGRRVPAENLHLTMAFVGNVDDAAATEALAAGAAASAAADPFELSITGSGHRVRSGMLWLRPAAVPAPLLALREALEAALAARNLPTERRPFRPHVTLARKVTTAPPERPAFDIRWSVRELALVASATPPEGARYTPVRFWPLAGTASHDTAPGAA
ncbi:MAG: RNA 2',3'-cyclic phosphodiesterase [Gammaproteobacteria bacterium]|nr:RNA 2',3'-cyclic phosphodiesterase [Gammaproteobacteria bacterium]NNL99344.1 RNA 2',3'-cyclic phosphodiesterase [Gammaproteobacteria bacterium]